MEMIVFESNELIDGDAVIGIKQKKNKESYGIHYHKFIELVYITEGEAVEYIDGVKYYAKAGDMMFIGYGASHSYETQDGFSHIEIFFSPKLVETGNITAENALALLALSSFDDMRGEAVGGKISFAGDDRCDVEFILRAMLSETEKKLRLSRTVIENYLNVLLVKMLRRATSSADEMAKDVFDGLRSYIDAHPEEHMTLSSLASKSFYNPSYLSRVFKQKFGKSPIEYVRERRITKATELLIDSEYSIDEIMAKVGFSDRSAFYHHFAKQNGLTPAEYRSKYKK